ncbi:MAG TPA: flavodoxin domain-containing protein [Actinomycetales bacterium]|nr:flavodoxin domain-containing protein [Actinomycetales bacterium]
MAIVDVAVVYESMFGMTHDVAEAVAEGVAEAYPDARVMCLRVSEAATEKVGTPDLLIVGGPTHMRGMSSSMSRKMAVSIEEKAERGEGQHQGHGLEPDMPGEGLRDWFHHLAKVKGHAGAAFDTRGDYGPMVGGAAHGIARRLERHGYRLAAEPEGFIVEGDAGQLREGERERARAWAVQVTRDAAQARAASR